MTYLEKETKEILTHSAVQYNQGTVISAGIFHITLSRSMELNAFTMSAL